MSRFRGSVPRRLAADLSFTVGQNSLVVGKNAGNFAESAHFCENPSRKHLRIQSFAGEFPTRERREFFGPRREFSVRSELGAKSIRAFRCVQLRQRSSPRG